jgi:hypothetical protein
MAGELNRHLARPEHEVLYQELIELVNRHARHLSAAEILAVSANMVGKLLALQDQSSMTPHQGLELIGVNVEAGNRQAVDELRKTKGVIQ